MRRRNREIGVFSMSALDLFCSAMGAFMLIFLIAMPYYRKSDDLIQQIQQIQTRNRQLEEEDARMREQNRKLQVESEETGRWIRDLEARAADMSQRLSRTFLVIIATWNTMADIDLHVETPAGNRYSYQTHNRLEPGGRRPHYPGEDAELSFDANAEIPSRGGVEVWKVIQAAPGRYLIGLDKFNPNGDTRPTEVELLVLHRDGSEHRGGFRLSEHEHLERAVMTISVSGDGEATIR